MCIRDRSGLLERVRARLRDCTVEVFDQVVPDPPLELVAQGARALAEFRPQAVVAFGGGSPMDCAKAMLEFGKKLGTGADIRFVAVPTTAGTGSEVTSFAVLTDRAKGVKYPLVDDALLPDEAILDPSLLAGVDVYKRQMVNTVTAAEEAIDYWGRFRERSLLPVVSGISDAITHSCCLTAMDLNASAILAATRSGYTAKVISRFRPACPIVALCQNESTRRQLAISWGVHPYLSGEVDSTARMRCV